ncbi:MAG: thioesterase family protein [Acidaminococcaceae bacterium]|nr:thioesterase family protein [Acidaminococcaceae bacterium]
MIELKIGLTATESTSVLYTNTALALGSGSLQVYATPALIALMEQAACSAINNALAPDTTSVGIAMNMTHDAASLPGQKITATATLVAIDGKKLTFSITASDKQGQIGQATHQRFIVTTEKFLSKLQK